MSCNAETEVLRIALAVPLRRIFDYLPPDQVSIGSIIPGVRVRVPFGRSKKIGVVVDVATGSEIAVERLKPCEEILDSEPLFSQKHLQLISRASAYYHHPIGEVIFSALPAGLRKGLSLEHARITHWKLNENAPSLADPAVKRAPRQRQILKLLMDNPQGLSAAELQMSGPGWRSIIKRLEDKGWLGAYETDAGSLDDKNPARGETEPQLDLNPHQQAVVSAIANQGDEFNVFLVDGVTGSGKTEIYFHLIDRTLRKQRQILVLIPEIGLTAQLIERFQKRFNVSTAILHSGLSDRERQQAWLRARDGIASIVIGTRSAIWTPLNNPGLIVVDEEHDQSYKQQDGFRYSARDIAILRGQREKLPVVLGSATPSLESLNGCDEGRFHHLLMPERAGAAKPPRIRLIDIRRAELETGLSDSLIQGIDRCLQSGKQALLFLNRRGFAPVMMCHNCGWLASCRYCDANLTIHRGDQQLRCHHCGARQAIVQQCQECEDSNLIAVGQGTERITEVVADRFPGARILRVDRDTTRKKGQLNRLLESIHKGEADILVGTQMLSKGHHFPNVTLVGVLDADNRLYGSDFRSTERLVQLIIQVAGRAGRGEHPGEVMIQTHHPDHPLFSSLANYDFVKLSRTLMEERQIAELPPFSSMVLIRADARRSGDALEFLELARQCLPIQAIQQQQQSVDVWGPVVAQMEKRAGRYRAQLIVVSKERRTLQWLLSLWITEIEKLKPGSGLRWFVDVDPQDMF